MSVRARLERLEREADRAGSWWPFVGLLGVDRVAELRRLSPPGADGPAAGLLTLVELELVCETLPDDERAAITAMVDRMIAEDEVELLYRLVLDAAPGDAFGALLEAVRDPGDGWERAKDRARSDGGGG